MFKWAKRDSNGKREKGILVSKGKFEDILSIPRIYRQLLQHYCGVRSQFSQHASILKNCWDYYKFLFGIGWLNPTQIRSRSSNSYLLFPSLPCMCGPSLLMTHLTLGKTIRVSHYGWVWGSPFTYTRCYSTLTNTNNRKPLLLYIYKLEGKHLIHNILWQKGLQKKILLVPFNLSTYNWYPYYY